MKRILVSGCYDILHAGHLEFFSDARALGDHLTVCVPSDRVIRLLKNREPAIPEEHRLAVVESLDCVDEACIGDDDPPHLNFASGLRLGSTYVSTDDDKHVEEKAALCNERGVVFIQIEKKPPSCGAVTTTSARRRSSIPAHVPLRVDFAGGWLDVPKLSRPDGYIVNCAITPTVSMDHWPYNIRSGLGGSAARSMLLGEDPVASELGIAGWQDPAVIQQTGLCIWRSGKKPVLEAQINADWLKSKMALEWTGKEHDTHSLVDVERNYESIARISRLASRAVSYRDLDDLMAAVNQTYYEQIEEGMFPVPALPARPPRIMAPVCKYVGSGHGGYILWLFHSMEERLAFSRTEGREMILIEPYAKW